MPKGEIVGRFIVGSKLVIDGKNNDGKDKKKNNDGKNKKIMKVDEIAKQRNSEVAKAREDLGHRIWGIYEGSIAIRYGEVARWIIPRVIQLPKIVKESWPSIRDSHGPLIHRTRGKRSSCR
jgi:hypothetical protein